MLPLCALEPNPHSQERQATALRRNIGSDPARNEFWKVSCLYPDNTNFHSKARQVLMGAVRVLIADAHEITRIGIKSVLARNQNYEVCAEAADGRTAVEMTRRLRPDLVILEISLPLLNGLQAARQITSDAPTPIVIFTDIYSDRVMRETLELSIRGFVLKSDPLSDLKMAAEAVIERRTFFTSRMMRMVIHLANKQTPQRILTAREREIVQLLVEGYCSKEIAKTLGISVHTVETHRSKLMRKIDVHSIPQVVLYAIRNEIIHLHRLDELQVVGPGPYEYDPDGRGIGSVSQHPIALTIQVPSEDPISA